MLHTDTRKNKASPYTELQGELRVLKGSILARYARILAYFETDEDAQQELRAGLSKLNDRKSGFCPRAWKTIPRSGVQLPYLRRRQRCFCEALASNNLTSLRVSDFGIYAALQISKQCKDPLVRSEAQQLQREINEYRKTLIATLSTKTLNFSSADVTLTLVNNSLDRSNPIGYVYNGCLSHSNQKKKSGWDLYGLKRSDVESLNHAYRNTYHTALPSDRLARYLCTSSEALDVVGGAAPISLDTSAFILGKASTAVAEQGRRHDKDKQIDSDHEAEVMRSLLEFLRETSNVDLSSAVQGVRIMDHVLKKPVEGIRRFHDWLFDRIEEREADGIFKNFITLVLLEEQRKKENKQQSSWGMLALADAPTGSIWQALLKARMNKIEWSEAELHAQLATYYRLPEDGLPCTFTVDREGIIGVCDELQPLLGYLGEEHRIHKLTRVLKFLFTGEEAFLHSGRMVDVQGTTRRAIGAATNLDIATVSRLFQIPFNIQTPCGSVSTELFFRQKTGDAEESRVSVFARIMEWIHKENTNAPLADDEISGRLGALGLPHQDVPSRSIGVCWAFPEYCKEKRFIQINMNMRHAKRTSIARSFERFTDELKATGNETRYAAFEEVIRSIPPGKVAAYGQVAEVAGHPRGHRLVARFLSEMLYSDIPWQRVVGAGGAIKTSGKDAARQRSLLKAEGISFTKSRIDMDQYGYDF